MNRAQLLSTLLCALVTATLVGCDREPTDLTQLKLLDTPPAFEISTLIDEYPAIWQARLVDLSESGQPSLLLFGHENGRQSGVCEVMDGCELRSLLPPGRDRHSCATADLNNDKVQDFFCTTGAGRGAETNPHELWLSRKTGVYRKQKSVWGATEGTARGRYAEFFHLDNDEQIDLITAAWGLRLDGEDNQTKVWRNNGKSLKPVEAPISTHFGSHCLTVGDLNQDGFDEVLGCGSSGGLFLLPNAEGRLEPAVNIGLPEFQYFSIALGPVRSPKTLVASTAGKKGRMFVDISELDAAGESALRRRFSCQIKRLDDEANSPIFCGAVQFFDFDRDGNTDLIISRRKGWLLDDLQGDIADLVVFGPSFEFAAPVPDANKGYSYQLLTSASGVIQVNAGEKWSGSVRLIGPIAQPISSDGMEEM